jgi:hypothetical protein
MTLVQALLYPPLNMATLSWLTSFSVADLATSCLPWSSSKNSLISFPFTVVLPAAFSSS